ncbi:MAG: 2,3-bisphosphoglycerate-independent phosphoglycerate mutase [Acholeplasmatales bacterium]|nr:2,3-bisphosphoglycerate-independent phosphoglycerate mutase [Acholeplasmatales bacterium]
MNKQPKLVALIILDGFGIAPSSPTNAVSLAHKPYFDSLIHKYPHATLEASGLSVGLPRGQMGNSEVGHLTLGSGRIINQSLTRINLAIEDGSFMQNPAYLQAIEHVKKNNSTLHFMGLVSDGGVHSQLEHFKAFYDLFKAHGVEKQAYLHAFLDGRDTGINSGYGYVESLIKYGIQVGSVSGRYYAMDRDSNFDRLQKAYDILTKDTLELNDPLIGIQNSYRKKVTDEFIIPFKVTNKATIKDDDAVIFVNFRPDRAIRIATALSNPDGLEHYYRPDKPSLKTIQLNNLLFVSTMHYADTVKGLLAFESIYHQDLLGEIIARKNLNQLRIAETEKYAHVTFFFDGGEDKEILHSKRVLIPSPKVATYDLKPEMSAYEVGDLASQEILEHDYSLVVLNFANPDMVGHTGIISATVKAIEAVDVNLKKVVEAVLNKDGVAIVLADHGNSEEMVDALGNVQTAHTTNLVPVIITSKEIKLRNGGLKDVAPTILELLGIDKPSSMTGESLIEKK